MSDTVRTASSVSSVHRLALGRFGPRPRRSGRLFRKYALLCAGLISFVSLAGAALDFSFGFERLAPPFGLALHMLTAVAVGPVSAIIAALLLARFMIVPIRTFAEGAVRIGMGELDRRIEIHTGDELETLAEECNRLAADLQKSHADLERRVEERTTELREALAQQTAAAEMLHVINSSPGDLVPVFDVLLAKATQLCGADFGLLGLYQGERFHTAAMRGVPRELAELETRSPTEPGTRAGFARLARGRGYAHFLDAADTDAYRAGDRAYRAVVDLGHARTVLTVPLVNDARVLGVLTLFRQEVRPFSDKQITLLRNFAVQAVIAMENARLITELRRRTRDLQEALEYQTATSDMLNILSCSVFDLQSVLDTLVATAARLCGAQMAHIAKRDGDLYPAAACFGISREFVRFLQEHPVSPGRETVTGRTVLEKRVVHVADIASDPECGRPETVSVGKIRTERIFRLVEAVGWDDALRHAVGDLRIAENETAMGEAAARRAPIQLADLDKRPSAPLRDASLAAGIRSVLIVPLVGPERILGALILQCRCCGEFPPATVRLMQTLASQSVLAIQNARLFREIAETNEQLALANQHKSQFLANRPGFRT
jgi:GAF domain-containing protein